MPIYERDSKKALAISLAILVLFTLPLFTSYAISIFLPLAVLSLALAVAVMKKRSIHSYNKRQVFWIVTVFAVLYLTLYFVSGLKYGFVISGGGRITLSSFLRYVLPLSVIIVSTEKIREIMLAAPLPTLYTNDRTYRDWLSTAPFDTSSWKPFACRINRPSARRRSPLLQIRLQGLLSTATQGWAIP